MSLNADLGSTATTLDQLISRIDGIVSELNGTADEGWTLTLIEVERSLVNAARRLDRLLRELPDLG